MNTDPKFVTRPSQVGVNIKTYVKALEGGGPMAAKLVARLSKHPAWYAERDEGTWRFGPSKFVGYADITPKRYLDDREPHHGSYTERELGKWFTQVDPASALGKELRESFELFISRFGKKPHQNWRVSIATDKIGEDVTDRLPSQDADMSRIVHDPGICGGRPRIRGTRVRVSDIVEMIASGAERSEILANYPYLEDGDITAALWYAARAIDHRVLRVA